MECSFVAPSLETATAVAIGTFDGVHLGHRQVIGQMQQVAQAQNLSPAVLSFRDHPLSILSPAKAPRLLSAIEEKCQLLQAFHLEHAILLPFTPEFSRLSPLAFVEDILVKQLKAKHITVGYNFTFGYQAQGTPDTLRDWGAKYGFGVAVIPPFTEGQTPVTSSRIRQLLSGEDFAQAIQLLGGAYLLSGKVIRGQGIAASVLEVPTANLQLFAANKQLPPQGVYSCYVKVPGQPSTLPGIMNIGMRPTFSGVSLSFEVHLMDFAGELYDETLHVYLTQFLRPEIKFDGIAALKSQIHQDIVAARTALQSSVSPPSH